MERIMSDECADCEREEGLHKINGILRCFSCLTDSEGEDNETIFTLRTDLARVTAERDSARTVIIAKGELLNAAHYLLEETRAERDALEVKLGEAVGEVERLKALLHRDKTGLALGLDKVRHVAIGFDWLCEGRGPYAYDDDRYRMEIASLITQVIAIAHEHLLASGKIVDEAFHPRAKETVRMLAEDCQRIDNAGTDK